MIGPNEKLKMKMEGVFGREKALPMRMLLGDRLRLFM